MNSVKVVDEKTLLVNLNGMPDSVVQEGWRITAKEDEHWVKVDKRADGLYLDDQKLILCFSEACADRYPLQGYELYHLDGRGRVDNINIAYALLEHPLLFPKEWEGHGWFDSVIWFLVGRGYSPSVIRGISRKNNQWEVHHNYRDRSEEVGSIERYPPTNEKTLYCPANWKTPIPS